MMKFIFAAIAVFLLLASCQDSQNSSELENRNQTSLIAFLENGWNKKDLDAVDTYFSKNIIRKVNSVNLASSKNELMADMQLYFTGFPDLEIQSSNMLADGSEIYMSWTITGTNTGRFGELPATGKKVQISGISRMEFDDEGKIVAEEVYYNELSLLQQMGHTLNPPVLE